MKRLILIPLLFISAFSFSQQIDTLLGYKGKIKIDTALTIESNYLFTPSQNHLSFDSTKLIWFLNGSKVYTDFPQVGLGSRTPRAKLMISDSTGAVSNNDSSGILLTNDTTILSPSLTFNAKSQNTTSGLWVNSGYRIFSNAIQSSSAPYSILYIQQRTNGGAYVNALTLNGGTATFAGPVSATGTSSFSTGITAPTISGTTISLGSFTAGYGITQTSSYLGFTAGGGFNIAPAINEAIVGTFKGIYFNPTITNFPNGTLIGYENVRGVNLLNSTSDNTGIGVTAIDHSAKLQVGGTSQGVLFPVVTQLQRDSLARPVTSVTITNAGSGLPTTTTGKIVFSAGAITATGLYTASGGVVTAVSVIEQGAYGAGQTPTITSIGGGAVLTPVLGASAPATGLTVFCSDCTATDSSTGVYQTWNGSTWKNWW